MVAQDQRASIPAPLALARNARILLIEARYYEDIARELLAGAIAEIEAAGANFHTLSVPGALEIPLALGQAIAAGRIGAAARTPGSSPRGPTSSNGFDGCVALGCVIRGETSHYEIVCRNANHWVMELAVRHAVPLGNGILTVESEAQAMERARGGRSGKGAEAVRACLGLIAIERALAEDGT
jgi:6,7-dimethyl-8-ribityllumazine synthase